MTGLKVSVSLWSLWSLAALFGDGGLEDWEVAVWIEGERVGSLSGWLSFRADVV